MHKRTLYLLRHGQPEDQGGLQDKAVFRGKTNSPLSARGWQQMQEAVAGLNFKYIISSPLQRCAQFARQLSKEKNLSVDEQAELAEIDFGLWDGQLIDDIAIHSKSLLKAFWSDPLNNTPPEGESLRDFHKRVIVCWNKIISTEQHLDTLIFIHGGVQKIILAHLLEMPLTAIHNIEVPYACCSAINIYYNEQQIKATLKHHGSLS